MTPGPPDPAEFRRVMGRFATGITVVTTVVDGVDHATTMSSFTSVSLDPLLVLFCVDKKARFHRAVLDGRTWAVSILGEDSRAASAWFATRGRSWDDQMEGWPTIRGALTGAPVLAEAIGALECRTHAVHDGGDHTVVIGEVLSATIPADHGPLLYYQGGYRRLGPEPQE